MTIQPHLILFQIIMILSVQNTFGMQLSPKPTTFSKVKLLQQASRVRKKLNLDSFVSPNNGNAIFDIGKSAIRPPNKEKLYFLSFYQQSYGRRGFCNWLIPGHVMIGQYPGQTPETYGPRKDEIERHMDVIVNSAKVKWFLSLQSEVPHQEDNQAWEDADFKVRLPIGGGREDFPDYFSHYAPVAKGALNDNDSNIQFSHSPILDLNTPKSQPLFFLLSELLQFLEDSVSNEGTEISRRSVYIHCWGGRGRAGLVGSCLLSLLFPELDADTCLEWVQTGYDSRDGAQFMPMGLKRSPQTTSQRNFVRDFASLNYK